MKKLYLPFLLVFYFTFTSCSHEEDIDPEESFVYYTTELTRDFTLNHILVPENSYGPRLYPGTKFQITEGPRLDLYDLKVFAQFPVNYGATFDQNSHNIWDYSYELGGFSLSRYHDMNQGNYYNQLSVYSTDSPSAFNDYTGLFMVANGYSNVTDPAKATLADYYRCAHIFITTLEGYAITEPGQPGSHFYGTERRSSLVSVWVNNTTYAYLAMKNGNSFASALNRENKGWFKVQFLTFKHYQPSERPSGCVEFYLANFDESLADGWTGIRDEWELVDLSSLPECSVIVVNFVGSDTGEYGLNTPAYCALDNFTFKTNIFQWLGETE